MSSREFGIGLGMNELPIFLWLWNLEGWESNSQIAMRIYGYLISGDDLGARGITFHDPSEVWIDSS